MGSPSPAYRLDPSRPLGEEMVRVACEQLEAGLRTLGSRRGSLAERIHTGRTTCKKVRALLRLVRTIEPRTATRENARLRAAARRLSELRDVHALAAAAATLPARKPAVRAGVWALRRKLARRCAAAHGDAPDVAEALDACRAALRASLAHLRRWRPRVGEFTDLLPGLAQCYRRARRLERKAPAGYYHEWRKAVKAVGYQARLLCGRRPMLGRSFGRKVDRLGRLLGCEHDLTLLLGYLLREVANRPVSATELQLWRLMELRRAELRRKAHAVARQALAERPGDWALRIALSRSTGPSRSS